MEFFHIISYDAAINYRLIHYSIGNKIMHHQRIKSYVLRAGRVSNRQNQGLLHRSEYELNLGDTPWDFQELLGRDAKVVVEIGFGMGASLLTMAKDNPDIQYVGIEVHQPGVGSLLAGLKADELNNVHVVVHDAVEVFKKQIPDNSLIGIQIFFPDPWPKKRHHKRRLIQSEFIELLVRKLQPGGFIHCATDWQEYAEHMLMVLNAERNLVNQEPALGYAKRPASRPLTKFEQRGEKLGHGVWDLIFNKPMA